MEDYIYKVPNTDISLETITELFEEGVNLEDLNKILMSWF